MILHQEHKKDDSSVLCALSSFYLGFLNFSKNHRFPSQYCAIFLLLVAVGNSACPVLLIIPSSEGGVGLRAHL